jgi:hypothetical protein
MALPIIPILLGLGAAGIGGAAAKGGETASEKWWSGDYGPQGPLGRIASAPIAGLSDIASGVGYLFTGNKGAGTTATPTETMTMPPMSNMTPEQAAAFYDKYMGGGGGGGGVSAAQRLNQQEQAALRNYWNNLNQYGQNRSAALRDMFSGVSAARARAGQSTERAGTNLAADIENLYARLGAQTAQPMMAEGSPTAGLAPASGAMATAAQTVPAEGANLANFLAAATGAEARNIYDIAAAQAQQGTSLSQNFLDALTMAEQQAILEQRNRAAARIAQAQQAAAAQSAAQQNARNQFLMEYELGQMGQTNQAATAEFLMANLKSTDKEAYDRLAKTTGQYGLTPEQFARQRPDLASALLGG